MLRHRRGIVAGGLLIVLALAFGAWSLFSSRRAAEKVAEQLENLLGAPVRVGSVHVSLFGASTVRQLQVFEAGASADAEPWLEVDEATADLSLWDLIGDPKPKDITLKGLSATLRFDSAKQMLTRLPAPSDNGTRAAIPHLRIANGQFTLAQEGRPPMIVSGISACIDTVDSALELNGTVEDAYWGNWQATADLSATADLTLKLSTEKVAVDQAKLEALPFIAPAVWRQVRAEGETPVDLTLRWHVRPGESANVHYRVVLTPENAHVHVPSIGLDAEQATGQVVVEDKQVRLRDVTGVTADGTIQTNADLDFRAATTMRFQVDARNLALRKLPRSWSVPLLDGLLSGKADLQVAVRDGKVSTTGRGEGVIKDPHLAVMGPGRVEIKPIHLALRADGGRFRIEPARSAIKTLLPRIMPLLK